MKWVDRLAGQLGFVRRPKRAYAAAKIDRLTNSWVTFPLTANSEIRYALRIMRARSRELTQNNDYAKKFVKMVVNNVVGPRGIVFQSKAQDPNGKPDVVANKLIEKAFGDWGKKQNASVEGTLSWLDMQRLFIESVARDGEILVRKVRGYNNPFKFALQFIEADHLDETLNQVLENGNTITMGVERDPWKKPVAYHLLTRAPGELLTEAYPRERYEVVPAKDIIHAYLCERPGQARGVPWMHSAMTRLNMLGGYEEAELVAARVAACKMGFFTSTDGQSYVGDDKDAQGNLISEAEPGTFEQLPTGTTVTPFLPEHPTGNFHAFMKTMLRGVSSGLQVSYNMLASDLEGVNYSSIRQGVLDERDAWRVMQQWMIEHFCEEVFTDFLDMALLTKQIPLPPEKFSKFNAPVFGPRGWGWVDPFNDIKASALAISQGLKTRTSVLADEGFDREDVFKELAEEDKLATSLGLEFAPLKFEPLRPDTAGSVGDTTTPQDFGGNQPNTAAAGNTAGGKNGSKG